MDRALRWLSFWAYSVLVFVSAILPDRQLPRVTKPPVHHFDKILHFGTYLALFLVTIYVFKRARSFWLFSRATYLALFYCFMMGMVTEWAQFFVPSRSTEFGDWIANVLGMYSGWLVYSLAEKFWFPEAQNGSD